MAEDNKEDHVDTKSLTIICVNVQQLYAALTSFYVAFHVAMAFEGKSFKEIFCCCCYSNSKDELIEEDDAEMPAIAGLPIAPKKLAGNHKKAAGNPKTLNTQGSKKSEHEEISVVSTKEVNLTVPKNGEINDANGKGTNKIVEKNGKVYEVYTGFTNIKRRRTVNDK